MALSPASDLRQGLAPPGSWLLPVAGEVVARSPSSSKGLCLAQSQDRNPGLLEPRPRGTFYTPLFLGIAVSLGKVINLSL